MWGKPPVTQPFESQSNVYYLVTQYEIDRPISQSVTLARGCVYTIFLKGASRTVPVLYSTPDIVEETSKPVSGLYREPTSQDGCSVQSLSR